MAQKKQVKKTLTNQIKYWLDKQVLNNSFEGLFSIHELTGEIIVAKPLDREVKDILSISVFAVDDGELQRSDKAEVEFFLTDVNDNSPVIRPQKSEASVFEVLIRA